MRDIHAAFFTEAGRSRGMGHLIRSFAISRELQSLGVKISFFLDSDISFDEKFKGITYFSWDQFNLLDDYDIVFIDSYEADIGIYLQVSHSCKVAVYLDDFKRLDYPKGVILNFAPDADVLFYKDKKEGFHYLLGLEYLPIRSEFASVKRTKRDQLFIMLGGSDTANLSLDMADALKDIKVKKVIVSNNVDTVNLLSKYLDVEVLYKPSDEQLIKTMASSSLAISTASMSAYELAYLKIPTIITAVAENQETGALQFVKHNLSNGFVSIKGDSWKADVQSKIRSMLGRKSFHIDNAIDGNGVSNIATEVLKLAQ